MLSAPFPVLLDICKDMREVCPDALLINHTNPMAMNSWAVYREGGVRYVGLCHGVEGGATLIAEAFDIPAKELDFICAGINHQGWYIKLSHKGRDLTGRLLKTMESHPKISKREPVRLQRQCRSCKGTDGVLPI